MRLLCLGAHCDDVEIGCGGSLLRLLGKRPGCEVHWVVFSSNPEREAEARASAGEFLAAASRTTILAEEHQVPPGRLLLFSWSLGSGVAVEVATRIKAAGLVLDGAFTSIPDAGQAHYPWMPVRLLARNRFASIEKIDRVNMPVLFIHSVGDTFVQYAQGRELFERAREPKHWLEVSDGDINAGFTDLRTLGLAMAQLLVQ